MLLVGARRPGDAEVAHHGVAGLEEDVLRLHVPVDQPLGMGVLERVPDLRGDAYRLVEGQPTLAVETDTQGLALHEGHHEVDEPVGHPRVVQREHVGVVEAGDDLDLPQEALGPHAGGDLGPQHLEGHGTPVLQVVGEVDQRHPALAQEAVDAVALVERGLQAVSDVHHGQDAVIGPG